MSLRSARSYARAFLGAAFAAALGLYSSHACAQRSEAAVAPFEGLSGTWSGNGSILFGSGDKERIRCRVNYEVAENGNRFQQDLRCASDSYKFEMKSDVASANGYVTGRWSENTRNKHGTISGRIRDGQIEALADTAGFSAFLTLNTRGDRQTVKIQSKSNDVSEVSITLRRSSR